MDQTTTYCTQVQNIQYKVYYYDVLILHPLSYSLISSQDKLHSRLHYIFVLQKKENFGVVYDMINVKNLVRGACIFFSIFGRDPV
jgi:hypothetical protein